MTMLYAHPVASDRRRAAAATAVCGGMVESWPVPNP
nr:MAG TPA: hypothetical protein [Caudoviricetes sp.]